MNGLWFMFAMLLASALFARADQEAVNLKDLVEGARQWALENFDTNQLDALPAVDGQLVRQFFQNAQQRFQGDYVVNLAVLKPAAHVVLPLLASRAETQPYAAWLTAQLDYFDVADEIQITVPPPTADTNRPPPVVANPSPQKERELWVRKVAGRPWPAAAKNYVRRLKPVFAAQTVPPELVWLAEVESAFDPSARSPAGAAGLFQLMPDTAKRFGLSLRPRDERFQPGPSATASAQYLKQLHDRFGDWRLALAAYNAGAGTVQKLLDHHPTRSYDDIAGQLPAETQLYVPRVEAVLRLREGVNLEQLAVPRS